MSGEDILSGMRRLLSALDQHRHTVICRPELAAQLTAIVEASPMAGLITVQSNASCPADRVYVINDAAAGLNTAAVTPDPTPPTQARDV